VEGVGGFASKSGGGVNELLAKQKKLPSKSVKIAIEGNEITVEVFILVQYGNVIAEVSAAVQSAVIAAVESMTGVSVRAVNVTIGGIAFEKISKHDQITNPRDSCTCRLCAGLKPSPGR